LLSRRVGRPVVGLVCFVSIRNTVDETSLLGVEVSMLGQVTALGVLGKDWFQLSQPVGRLNQVATIVVREGL
jgi:hypothetical protein